MNPWSYPFGSHYPQFNLIALSGPLDAFATAADMVTGRHCFTVMSPEGGAIQSCSGAKLDSEIAIPHGIDTFVIVSDPKMADRISDRMCARSLDQPEVREWAISWLADRVNIFVNVPADRLDIAQGGADVRTVNIPRDPRLDVKWCMRPY